MSERSFSVLRLKSTILLTYFGLLSEQCFRVFWPSFSLSISLLSLAFLGVQNNLSINGLWFCTLAGLAMIGGSFFWGLWKFQIPNWSIAKTRLDQSFPARPLQGLSDKPLLGRLDPESQALWTLHQCHLLEEASKLKAIKPDFNLMQRDPFGLRFSALLLFFLSVLCGSIWNLKTVIDLQDPQTLAGAVGPQWEGWITPPAYTALPTLYLNDLRKKPELSLLKGSKIEVRAYSALDKYIISETVSARGVDPTTTLQPEHIFEVQQSGELKILGPQEASWVVQIAPDFPPEVSWDGTFKTDFYGESEFLFSARDDFGVTGGNVRIELDLNKVDRRFGLLPLPRVQNPILLDVPMPLVGSGKDFDSKMIEDFSDSVWANLPVKISVEVQDALSQSTQIVPVFRLLPGRKFFDPLASALIEQRRDLLWSDDNAKRVANMLRAISHKPKKVFRKKTDYLRLKFIIERLETGIDAGLLAERRYELEKALWDLALSIEDGDVDTALERIRRAQERLTQAMKNSASDEEIAELMQELRDANEDYLRQLAREAAKNTGQIGDQRQDGQSMNLSQNDLQDMMDHIQELMELGRMAEAQQALDELQEMMENMRVAQGQGGKGSQGEQSTGDLTETLREQQRLSDEAFQNLQRQFKQSQNDQGQSQRGKSQQGHSQQGQSGQQQAGNEQSDEGNGEGVGPAQNQGEGDLASRQGGLQKQLQDQQNVLPQLDEQDGVDTNQSIDDAQDAMRSAQEALEEGDIAGALDSQSKAMDSLREGIRNLSRSLSQNNQGPRQEGGIESGQRDRQSQDPLGRSSGAGSSSDTQGGVIGQREMAKRAKELLEEIRRRAGERERSEDERNYLKKLLEKF